MIKAKKTLKMFVAPVIILLAVLLLPVIENSTIYAANDEGKFGEIKKYLQKIVREYKSVPEMHGFYVDETQNNVYFDLILDFKEENKERIKNEIIEKIKFKYYKYDYNVILDSDISD